MKFPTAISVKWSRKKRDPGQTWRFWIDRGQEWTSIRAAWFYITIDWPRPAPHPLSSWADES